ncbi:chemotaxis protein CheC [Zooshikella ganghwensis]|uniref:chemotaxis protein CheC n=1 Tax=Zooshikella ganghwensis TaxID=202772 RepID=UPI001F161C65|nr:chemotaxis protein CheC [Zooshikella ganghwensis]
MNEDQLDVLQELMNIAMGQAANKLARLVEAQVSLSIPKIHAIDMQYKNKNPTQLSDSRQITAITRQSFLGKLRGEVLVCFGTNGADEIAELMGYSDNDEKANEELILDITNILTGACIQGLANQIEVTCSFNPPSLFSTNTFFDEALTADIFDGRQTLVMEINFTISSHSFCCDLLICIANESVPTLLKAIDKLLSKY